MSDMVVLCATPVCDGLVDCSLLEPPGLGEPLALPLVLDNFKKMGYFMSYSIEPDLIYSKFYWDIVIMHLVPSPLFNSKTDCMNLGTHVVTCSFKPASLNPKTASCPQF